MYNSRDELPATIQSTLPIAAQDLYIEQFNQALDREEIQPQGSLSQDSMAHQIAWSAVEQEFVKDNSSGQWHRRGEPVPETQSPGILDRIKNIF